jgi:hypothetical protein
MIAVVLDWIRMRREEIGIMDTRKEIRIEIPHPLIQKRINRRTGIGRTPL